MSLEKPPEIKENLEELRRELATKLAEKLSGQNKTLSTEGWIEPKPDWRPKKIDVHFNQSPLREAVGGQFSFAILPGRGETNHKYFYGAIHGSHEKLEPYSWCKYNKPTKIPLRDLLKIQEIIPDILEIIHGMQLDEKSKKELLKNITS